MEQTRYSKEAKIGLYGAVCFTFASYSVHSLQEVLRKKLNIPEYWVYVGFGVTFTLALFFIWISDCYGTRKSVCVFTFFCPLISLLIMSIAFVEEIPIWLRTSLYVGASSFIVWHHASVGIILSLLFEQVGMDTLAKQKSLLMKYIFYFFVIIEWCEIASEFFFMFIPNLYFVIVTSLISLLNYIVIEIILCLGNYKFEGPWQYNALKNCLAALFKRNIYLKTSEKTSDDEAAIQLMAVLFPVWWIVACRVSTTMIIMMWNKHFASSTVGSIKLLTILLCTIFMAFFQLLIVNWLRVNTFLKMSLHYVAISFFMMSLGLFLGALSKLNFESRAINQPDQPGFGHVKFYNFVPGSDVKITIHKTNLVIPYMKMGSFLKVPVTNVTTIATKITHTNLSSEVKVSYSVSIEVVEMESMSYIFENTIYVLLKDGPDPVKNLTSLDHRLAYFYVFRGHESNNISFYQGNRLMYDIRFPSEIRLFHVIPGRYTVSSGKYAITSKLLEDKNDFELLQGNIYCAIYSLTDFENLGYRFFSVASIPHNSTASKITQIVTISLGMSLFLISMCHFLQTESPTYLKATTFNGFYLLDRLSQLITKQIMDADKVTSDVLFSTSFLNIALGLVALNYAIRFKFSKNAEA